MLYDWDSWISDYIASEYFSFLEPGLKSRAEALLAHFFNAATTESSDFPLTANSRLFSHILCQNMAQLELPATIRTQLPDLLEGFFEYLGLSGKYPQATTWLDWFPHIRKEYGDRFRPDGSVKGTTVRHPIQAVGRNEPCPCGSGKKYKKCCMP